jgi:hypothetical protein
MLRALIGSLVVAPAFGLALLVATDAGATCRDVWIEEGGPGGQVRKRTVCDDDVRRGDVEWRMRELERRERRRTRREEEERWERRTGPVIVLPPSDDD